jgi:creatinine amidohydrolase
MIGQAVIDKLKPAIEDISIFLPMLWLGASDHHLAFPGTVSIPQDTYVKVLEGIVESAIMAGYRKILLLNSHAGNLVPAQLALTNLQLEYKDAIPELFVALTSWFDIASREIAAIDDLVQPSVSHACEWETSIMLTAHPDLVIMAQAAGAHIDFPSRFFQPDYRAPQRVFVARTMDQGTTTGAYGQCELASAEKGNAILSAATAVLAEFVREFHSWPVVTPQPEA